MNDLERLLVIWDQKTAGTLNRHTRGRVVFQYSQEWLNNNGKPISISLPCKKERYSPAISTAFFENLLPESNIRTILAFNHRFDKKDTFAFLKKFGEDCAGALSIVPEKNKIDFTPGQYKCIDRKLMEALEKIMADPGKYKLFPEMKRARLSIAGAQDKLPVYIKENRFYLPLTSGSATTHIIKPFSTDFQDIPRNEAFCMELAKLAGLDVPDSRLMKIGNHELFVIDRYDRQITPDNIIRIHQENFCQALGLPANRKYQESGGPGFRQCRQLIDEYLSDQGVDIRINFAHIMAFNYLIGNHDAHGKNFSIIHENGTKFAPFYDLVSTTIYPLEHKFAMAIGQTYRFDRIKDHSLKNFAKDMNFRPKKLACLTDEMIQAVDKALIPLFNDHEKKYGASKIYDNLLKVIQGNLKHLEIINNILY